MNSLLKAAQRLWIRAQLAAPSTVRTKALPFVNDLKEIARLVLRPYLPVCELRGQGIGGPLAVTFVNVRFAKRNLEGLLFLDTPTEHLVGQLPFWECRRLAQWPSGDILVVEGSNHLICRLPRRSAIVIPESVSHIFDVTGDWQTVEERIHWNIRKKKLPRVLKRGYELAISRDDRDFDEFYSEIYLPTTRARHGDESQPMPPSMAHQYFRRGFVVQIRRDGGWVAGAVCRIEQATLVMKILGARDGDAQEMNQGVLYALYYLTIRWAHEQGLRAIDFTTTGPLLELGLFQHKRRWGTTISAQRKVRRQTWIQIKRSTPAVARFLKDNPFIVVDQKDRIHGLIAVDDPAAITDEIREDWEKRYATPGLDSLIVRAVASFVEPKGNDLVMPLPPVASPMRAWNL